MLFTRMRCVGEHEGGKHKLNLGVSWTRPPSPPPSATPQPSPKQRQIPFHNRHPLLHLRTPGFKRGSRSWVSAENRLKVLSLLRRHGIFFYSRGPFQLIVTGFRLLFASPPIGGSRCPAKLRRRTGRAPCCPWESSSIECLG